MNGLWLFTNEQFHSVNVKENYVISNIPKYDWSISDIINTMRKKRGNNYSEIFLKVPLNIITYERNIF